MLMWDDTKEIANKIWSLIPEKFKYNCAIKKNKKTSNPTERPSILIKVYNYLDPAFVM